MRRRAGCSLRAGARPLRASPWLLLCVGCRSSRSLGFRVRKRRWLYDHVTNLVTDVGPEGFADEAVLAGGTCAPSILGFSTRVGTAERWMHHDSGECSAPRGIVADAALGTDRDLVGREPVPSEQMVERAGITGCDGGNKELLWAGSVPAPTHREWRRVFEFLASGADSSGSVTPASGPPNSRAKRQLGHSQSPPARPARTAAVPIRPVPDSTCSTSANARSLRTPAVQAATGSLVRHDERCSLLESSQAARAPRAATSNPERSTPSGSRSISSGCVAKTRQLWSMLIAAGGMQWTVIAVRERTLAGVGMTTAEWCTPTRLHSCSSG